MCMQGKANDKQVSPTVATTNLPKGGATKREQEGKGEQEG